MTNYIETRKCPRMIRVLSVLLFLIGFLCLLVSVILHSNDQLATTLISQILPQKRLAALSLGLLGDLPRIALILGASAVILSIAPFVFWRTAPLTGRVRIILQLAYLTVLFGILTLGYFQDATCLSGDGAGHIARIQTTFEILKGDGSLWWSDRWYAGYPFLTFYGPLFFTAVGLVNFVIGDVCRSTQILVWLMHILSGLVIFLYLRKILAHTGAAVVGSLAYVVIPQHFQTVSESGALPLALQYALFPCLMYVLEKFRRKESSIFVTMYVGGLVSAGLILGHVQYGTIAAILFGASIILANLYHAIRGRTQILVRSASVVIGIGVTACLLSLWIWIEFLTGRFKEVLSGNSSDLLISWPATAQLTEMLNFIKWSWHWSGFTINYAGLSIILLASVGIIGLSARKEPELNEAARPLFIGFWLSLIFTALNSRASNFWIFYLVSFVSIGTIHILRYFNHRQILSSAAILIAICCVILLDTMPGLVGFNPDDFSWSTKGLPRSQEILTELNETASLNGRNLTLTSDHRTIWNSTETTILHENTVFGHAPQDATLSYPFAAAIAMHASQEHFDRKAEFSQTTLNGFCLLGIKQIFIPAEHTPTPGDSSKEQLITLPNVDMLIFAPSAKNLEHFETPLLHETWDSVSTKFIDRSLDWPTVQTLIDGMHLDCAAGQAEQLFLRNAPELPQNTSLSQSSPTLHVINYEADATEVHAEIDLNKNGFLQLAYSYYPDLRIFIDSKATQTYRTAMNFVAVPVQGGHHTLLAVYDVESTIKLPLVISLLTLGIGALVLALRRSVCLNVYRRVQTHTFR